MSFFFIYRVIILYNNPVVLLCIQCFVLPQQVTTIDLVVEGGQAKRLEQGSGKVDVLSLSLAHSLTTLIIAIATIQSFFIILYFLPLPISCHRLPTCFIYYYVFALHKKKKNKMYIIIYNLALLLDLHFKF